MVLEEALQLISENKPDIKSILIEFKSRAECTKLAIQKLNEGWLKNNYLQSIVVKFTKIFGIIEFEKTFANPAHLSSILQEYLQPTDGEKCLMNQLGSLSLLGLKKSFLTFLAAQGMQLGQACDIKNHGGPPKIFISYSRSMPDLYPYEEWTQKFIKKLSEHLRESGIDVAFDKDVDEGCSHGTYMNTHVKERLLASDIIIVIGTECLFYKLNSTTQHVIQKEISTIIEKDINQKQKCGVSTIIPIIISGDYEHALPIEITNIDNGIAFEIWNELAKKLHYLDLLKQLIIHIYVNTMTLRGGISRPSKSNLIAQWDVSLQQVTSLYQCKKNLQIDIVETQNHICLHSFFAREYNRFRPTTINIDRNYVNQIKEIFSNQEETALMQIVVLTGGGGVGKTWTSAQYEKSEGEKYKKRLVIPGEINLIEQLQLVALELGIRSSEFQNKDSDKAEAMLVDTIFKKLDCYESFLIIIDNVKPSMLKVIKDNLICNGNKKKRHLLLTSRNQLKWKEWNWPEIEIIPFSLTDAFRYLKHYFPQEQDDIINTLAIELGRLPLALRYAVAYIGKSPVSEFLTNMAIVPNELFNQMLIDKSDYPLSVYKVLMLSFEKLLFKHNNDALQMLYLAAFLNPDNLPRELFKNVFDMPTNFDVCHKKLLKHSLISYVSSNASNFSMHRLLQLFIRHRLKVTEKIECFTLIIRLLHKVFHDGGGPVKMEVNSVYFDNFSYLLTYLTKDAWQDLSPDTLILLMGCYHVAFSFKLRISLSATDVFFYLERAKEINKYLEARLPNIKENEEYQEKIAIQSNIFVWRRLVDLMTETEVSLIEEQYEQYSLSAINYWTRRNEKSPNDEKVMRNLMVTTSNYGFLLCKQDESPEKYQGCLKLLAARISMIEECEGEMKNALAERWAQCLSAKAHVLYNLKQFTQALQEYLNSFKIYKQYFPAMHCNMIYISNAIARCYIELQNCNMTEDSAKQSLDLSERIDPKHTNSTVGLERLKGLVVLMYISKQKKDTSRYDEYMLKFDETVLKYKISSELIQKVNKNVLGLLAKLDSVITCASHLTYRARL